jgi:dTDP-4-dehydrorhamnose reductase
MKNIIITGGAGFIGSHVVRLFVNKYPEYHIINLDKLTYAGNLANLKDIEDKPNYTFVKGDICDFDLMLKLMQDYKVDGIIHLAAESHVDRSIKDPFTFAQTNVMGTLSLLQAAKIYWESLPEGYEGKRFYHISTDEVYGALQMTHPEGIPAPFTTKASSDKNHEAYGEEFFLETTKYNPHSPYSASKASSDHFVRAFHSLGCDITLGILVTLLKIEHHDGMVSSSHSRGTTESILFDTVGNIRKRGLVIETQSLRTSRKRNTPVDSLRTILSTGDRFTNISQEKGTSCKYLDIDKSQHLYLFYMSLQFGAIATAVPVAINRIIGLVNAGNMRKNIG